MAGFNFSDTTSICYECEQVALDYCLPKIVVCGQSNSSLWAIIITTVAMLCALWLVLPLVCNILLWPLWLCSGYHACQRWGCKRHAKSLLLVFEDCGKWGYKLRKGGIVRGQLCLDGSLCTPWLIILRVISATYDRYLVIPKDSVTAADFRFLSYLYYQQ